jgi:Ser/Thr protein kinase RdoA (MazF antagonist)
MAVKTVFTEDEFVALLAHYDLGDFREAKPLAAGTVQTNWLIITTQGRFIYKYYENRSSESVRFEANLMAYIRQRGFPCAAPMRDHRGRAVRMYRDKAYIIFEYIDGHSLDHLNPQQKTQVIQAAAQLQQITKTYLPSLRKFRWNYGPELCLQLAQAETRKVGTLNARAKLDWFEQQLSNLKLPPTLSKGICHCDYDLSNLLFRNGELVALVDFDDANYTYLTFDLVNLIDGWAWPYQGSLNLDHARQIARDYRWLRPLNRLESRHLFDVHKMQILMDGIWFFARGDVADFYERQKIDTLDSLGRDGYLEAVL